MSVLGQVSVLRYARLVATGLVGAVTGLTSPSSAQISSMRLQNVEGITALSQLCEPDNIRQVVGSKLDGVENVESAIFGIAVQLDIGNPSKDGASRVFLGVYSYSEESQRLLPEYIALVQRQLKLSPSQLDKRQILPCAQFYSASPSAKTSHAHSGLLKITKGLFMQTAEPVVLATVTIFQLDGTVTTQPTIASAPPISSGPAASKSASSAIGSTSPSPGPAVPTAPAPATSAPPTGTAVAAVAALPPSAPSPPISIGRRVALVVGNSAYAHVSALPNPRRDAEAIAKLLRQVGFIEVRTLMDANFADLASALKTFGDLAEGADWAMVYFAGHGIEMSGTPFGRVKTVIFDDVRAKG